MLLASFESPQVQRPTKELSRMATGPMVFSRFTFVRPKYLLFGFIACMVAYVLVHNERFLINSTDPVWQHYQPFKWWLLPHGICAACALLLGPMQFSDRLRIKYAKLHRVVGRFYVAGVFIGAPMGLYIQYFQERMGSPRGFTIATVADAFIWSATTAIALYFILKGKVQQHRQWMTRSFAVALVFLEVRVVAGITGWEAIPGAIETIVWMCVAFSLFFADVVLQWQELKRARPATPRPQPQAAD
jgi:uncharacterized membrane protein